MISFSKYFSIYIFFLIFSFMSVFSQTRDEIILQLRGIDQPSDLNLFTYFILENTNFVKSYIPQKYINQEYIYKVKFKNQLSDFINFLREPTTRFELEFNFTPDDSDLLEIYFTEVDGVSSNYIEPFNNQDLISEIKLNFETLTAYKKWEPKFIEKENNDNLSEYNFIPKNENIFATLNGRGEHDFYAFEANKTNFTLKIIVLNKSNLKPTVRIFNEYGKTIKEINLWQVKKEVSIKFKVPSNDKIAYFEISDDSSSLSNIFNRVLTNKYIFTILGE